MAIHKAKVVGDFKVCGVAPGGVVEIDDEQIYLPGLIAARHIELLIEDEPEPADKPKPQKRGA